MYSDTVNVFQETLRVLKQPPLVDVAEWADKYRVLDSTSSKKVGKFETAFTKYMVEIYKEITKGDTKQFSLMMASQLAKSELIINIILRYIHLDPCPMLIVQPTDEMARSFSKERLQPAINNCIVRTLVKDANKKDSGNTVTHKMFAGGFSALVGPSPAKLAARPIRLLFLDEVDRYPKSAGNEGSPISLAKKRTSTYDDVTKHIITGTPTMKGDSEIEAEYETSSQGHWYVPCPSCGEYQRLEWERIKWDKEEKEDEARNVRMVCAHCKKAFAEKQWKKGEGKWIHTFPERRQNLGYQLNALASPFRGWESIVKEWLDIKGDVEKLKAFINTVLAETYETEYKGKLDAKSLLKRTREKYDYLPDQVLILTAGVDIQDGWIAIEVVGWGEGFESWGMKYQILTGNMEQSKIWEELDKFLDQTFQYKNGDILKIYASCIDTGGHHTQKVYDFVSSREHRRILGIKGVGGENVPIFNTMNLTKNKEIHLISVGANALKDTVMARLSARYAEQGYCHFNGAKYSGYDLDYFKSLTAEIKVTDGKTVIWKKIQERNEGLDCRGYATVPFSIFSINPIDLSKLTREQLLELSIVGELKEKEEKNHEIDSKGVEV
ncbi:MAG: phage terminase large subunit family protein [Fusobacterium necrophorum]|nr:phage terminase large subunit family protein [Fusobacterium necrophorum]